MVQCPQQHLPAAAEGKIQEDLFMKKKNIFLVMVISLSFLLAAGDCIAEKKYKPGETAQSFHDHITGFPNFWKAEAEPDFSQRFSEINYRKNANIITGPSCRIRAKAFGKYLYEVSVDMDRSFPDFLSYPMMRWAFICFLITAVENADQMPSHKETIQAFDKLWFLVNSHLYTGNSPHLPIRAEAYGIQMLAVSKGDTHFLVMSHPLAGRSERLRKIWDLLFSQ